MPHMLVASYEHNSLLPGGWKFLAHVDGQFIPAYRTNAFPYDHLVFGLGRYSRTEDQKIRNLTGTWADPNGRFSISGYARNVFNSHSLGNGSYSLPTVLSLAPLRYIFTRVGRQDPRTFGVVLSAHF